MKEIWLERYRPETLKDVYGNQQAINTLKTCVTQGSIPNLILTGPPGVGKTSSLLCIARELLGDKFSEGYKELNASDDRGIDVVRDQIKTFAKKKVNLPVGRTKIILLDEADSLTEGAQHALRMIISNQNQSTRFVLSCNNSSKIIEAIQSRCIILRFSKLKDSQLQLSLGKIIQNQGIKITEHAFKTLLFIADGDMRQAINNLQACHFASQKSNITEDLVLHICDAPSIDQIRNILKLASEKNLHEALKRMHHIYEEGHSVYDITNMIHRVLLTMESEIPLNKIYEMLKYSALLKQRVLDGLTSQLQMGQFLANCSMI